MDYVFDAGTKGTGELLDTFFKYTKTQSDALSRYGLMKKRYRFQKKSDCVRLEAADILAWETRHQMRGVIFANPPGKPRRSYVQLQNKHHAEVFFITRPQIERWVKESRALQSAGISPFLV
jgi:tRNA1(Val) A37 N6-methylase TrmN6